MYVYNVYIYMIYGLLYTNIAIFACVGKKNNNIIIIR